MRIVKLSESDLKHIISKVMLSEQSEEEPKKEDLVLAIRKFIRGKISVNELYNTDEYIENIRVKSPLSESQITINLGNKQNFLNKINLDVDDAWFRGVILNSYEGWNFVDQYTIDEDFKEGYIFEYDLNEENLETLKDIAITILPQDKFDIENDEYRRKLHKMLLVLFPREIDYILGDYAAEKDNEMNAAAREAIKSEFDDKLEELNINLDNDMSEATITLSELFHQTVRLNLYTSNSQEIITQIIYRALGPNVGGWYENTYEFTDESKFDKESFNRYVAHNFEKILEKLEEESESEHTIKDYVEMARRILSKFKMSVWYGTPKNKDIMFSIRGLSSEDMTIEIDLKDEGTNKIISTTMTEEGFNKFLYQPSLFNLEDMY
jgi:hypothetical protein